jgi:RNA polymerase sigma factor (sigma-70 family)
MADTKVDLETIDIYLLGNEEEIAKGIRLIDAHFEEKILWIIRKKALSATPDELFDIYQEVLLGIYKKAQEGKYDPGTKTKTLMGLIYKIALNKAKDWLKRKFAQKRIRDIDQDVLVDSVAETIKDSGVYESWQKAHQNEERAIILETIRNLVPRLKYRQRQVAEIIVENFPKLLDLPDIKEQILDLYGEDITTVAIKSARKEVYNKVKEALSTAGYGEYTDD